MRNAENQVVPEDPRFLTENASSAAAHGESARRSSRAELPHTELSGQAPYTLNFSFEELNTLGLDEGAPRHSNLSWQVGVVPAGCPLRLDATPQVRGAWALREPRPGLGPWEARGRSSWTLGLAGAARVSPAVLPLSVLSHRESGGVVHTHWSHCWEAPLIPATRAVAPLGASPSGSPRSPGLLLGFGRVHLSGFLSVWISQQPPPGQAPQAQHPQNLSVAGSQRT